jgi:uncharacterized repeat protein (TIGR02543 family)
MNLPSNLGTIGASLIGNLPEDVTDISFSDKVSKPTDPAITTHYVFDGWYRQAACTDEWDFARDGVEENLVLYAKWQSKNFDVTFNHGSIGASTPTQSVPINTSATDPGTPVFTGYSFDGWYTTSSFAVPFDFVNTKIAAATTIYAKWTLINVPVSSVSITGGMSRYVYKSTDAVHTLQLAANVLPSNATSKSVSWTSSSPAIATVNAGLVRFTGNEGDVTITANASGKTSQLTIRVVKNITLISTPLKAFSIGKGKSIAVPVVSYEGVKEIAVPLVWKTSNAKVATVVGGKVKGAKVKKKGTAVITGTAANGKSVVVKVTVLPKAKKVTKFKAKAPKLKVGKSGIIKISKVAKTAGVTKITFKSSKAAGLYVDKAGKLTAKKKGKYTITVTVGSKKVKVKVTIK